MGCMIENESTTGLDPDSILDHGARQAGTVTLTLIGDRNRAHLDEVGSNNPEQFRTVIPGWKKLPLPIRQLGKGYSKTGCGITAGNPFLCREGRPRRQLQLTKKGRFSDISTSANLQAPSNASPKRQDKTSTPDPFRPLAVILQEDLPQKVCAPLGHDNRYSRRHDNRQRLPGSCPKSSPYPPSPASRPQWPAWKNVFIPKHTTMTHTP